jgi:hypothetical protein
MVNSDGIVPFAVYLPAARTTTPTTSRGRRSPGVD